MKNNAKRPAGFTRRAFLETSAIGGAGIALGLAAGNLLDGQGSRGDTVKLLTASGELVEVERRYLPPAAHKPVSNKALQAWMDETAK